MVGIIVATHGQLADALVSATADAVGAPTNALSICIDPDDDMEAVRSRMRSATEELDDGEGVIIFTDIFSATPSNLAVSLMRKNVETVAGVNLPMLMRAVAGSGGQPLREFAKELQFVGRQYISETPSVSSVSGAARVRIEYGEIANLTLALDKCIADLTMLRSLLNTFTRPSQNYPGIGHNRLSAIDANAPVIVEDALLAAVIAKREIAAESPQPDVIQLTHRLLKRLVGLLATFSGWAGRKADKFADGVIESVSKATGTALVIGVTAAALHSNLAIILPQLEEILQKLLSHLG